MPKKDRIFLIVTVRERSAKHGFKKLKYIFQHYYFINNLTEKDLSGKGLTGQEKILKVHPDMQTQSPITITSYAMDRIKQGKCTTLVELLVKAAANKNPIATGKGLANVPIA